MLRRLLPFLLLATLATARAAVPPLLDDAIKKLIADEDHWAFTQTSQHFDKNGKSVAGPTIEHYDPSQPFDEQWRLILFRGHAPTPGEFEAWRRDKDKFMKHRSEKSLGDALDLEHATFYGEDGSRSIFVVPILKGASGRFPADKLEVFMAVDRADHTLRAVSVKPKGPFRIAGIVKIDGGEVECRLDVILPGHTPALVWVRGSGTGHVFGVFRIGRGEEVNYTGFKRVRPFNDRFEVKIGDIRALNF